MLNSQVGKNLITHTFRGSLEPGDFMQARQFGGQAEASTEIVGVLWDFRLSFLTIPDDKYVALSKAIVNPDTLTSMVKRAFLVGSREHRERVEKVLGLTTVPWPWAVFEDEKLALEWLDSS